MPPRKRLGQLLTEMKIVDEHQLQSALGHQKQWGGKLGAILVQKGFCREDQVVTALSQHLNMPAVRLADAKIDPRAVKMVSRSVAERLHVFAYEVSGSGRTELITIAMSDPTDLSAVDQLAFHTGKRIKPMLAGDTEVVAAIQQHYAPEKPAADARAAKAPGGVARPTPGGVARPTPIAPMPAVAPAIAAAAKAPPPKQGSGFAAQPAPAVQPGPGPQTAGAEEAVSAEAAPEALEMEGADLPVDAPMDGLEPIAAHSQGETQGWAEGTPEGLPLETPESEAVRPPPAIEGWSEGDAT